MRIPTQTDTFEGSPLLDGEILRLRIVRNSFLGGFQELRALEQVARMASVYGRRSDL